MTVYREVENATVGNEFYIMEQDLYGSSRLGTRGKLVDLSVTPIPDPDTEGVIYVERGYKKYELSNHLGNVVVTISDRRESLGCFGQDTGTVFFYFPDIISASDYYPFGSIMPGREWSADRSAYGFNGKRKDLEGVGGGGATYDYGFRIYNPNLGRFLSTDPLFQTFPQFTPYQYAANKPIAAIDLDGLEDIVNISYQDGYKITPVSTTNYDYPGKLGKGMLNVYIQQNRESMYYATIAFAEDHGNGVYEYTDRYNFVTKESYDEFMSTLFSPGNISKPAVDLATGKEDYFEGQSTGNNCWATVVKIGKKFGVKNPGLNTKKTVIQTALESSDHKSISLTEKAADGVAAIDAALDNNEPIVVGVNHTLGAVDPVDGSKLNEGTTDHFVLIIGRGYDSKQNQYFYTFWDVGTSKKNLGASNNNRLYLKADNSLVGTSEYNKKSKTYTVTQVRKNQ